MTWILQLALLLLTLYVALLLYYNVAYKQLKPYNGIGHNNSATVAIIIPARNEALTITSCLQAIVAQTYPAHLLHIIVVNDYSTDDTEGAVKAFADRHKTHHIQVLNLQQYLSEAATNSHKKQGIAVAIQHTKAALIVCTDADCTAHPQWISNLISYQQHTNAACIAAPVILQPNNGKWSCVSIFQTLDFATLQGITMAAVRKQLYAMCNGANFCYTKAAYVAVNGFAGIDAMASGDDMLLMQKIMDKYPKQVAYLKSRYATVTTATVPSWAGLISQRVRWASKANSYTSRQLQLTLLLVFLVNVISLVVAIFAFTNTANAVWCFLFFLVKGVIEYFFLQPVLHFFKLGFLGKYFIPSIPIHIIYTVLIGLLGMLGKYSWKGRSS